MKQTSERLGVKIVGGLEVMVTLFMTQELLFR